MVGHCDEQNPTTGILISLIHLAAASHGTSFSAALEDNHNYSIFSRRAP